MSVHRLVGLHGISHDLHPSNLIHSSGVKSARSLLLVSPLTFIPDCPLVGDKSQRIIATT
jgi:hypothetical protein